MFGSIVHLSKSEIKIHVSEIFWATENLILSKSLGSSNKTALSSPCSLIFMNRETCFKCSLHKVCLKMINSRCYAIVREHYVDNAVCYLATNVQNISAIVLNSSNLSCKSWLGDSSALRHRSVHLCCQAHQIAIVVWCLTRHKKSCHLVGRRWNPSDYLKTCFYEAWLHISSQWWEPFSQKFSVWPQFIIFEVLVLNTWEKYSQKMKIN